MLAAVRLVQCEGTEAELVHGTGFGGGEKGHAHGCTEGLRHAHSSHRRAQGIQKGGVSDSSGITCICVEVRRPD